MNRWSADKAVDKNINQLWLKTEPLQMELPDIILYRPAAFIECRLSFRSVRAGFQHIEENYFTAWWPEGDLAVDWVNQAARINSKAQLLMLPPGKAAYDTGNYLFTQKRFDELESELIDYLLRTRRFSVFYNANYQVYSMPGEDRESFLSRVAEIGLNEIEPELKRLLNQYEMKIEQVREAKERRERGVSTDEYEEAEARWRPIFLESETRLADIFFSRFGLAISRIPLSGKPVADLDVDNDNRELHEELKRIEDEARTALNSIYTEYLSRVSQCDDFQVGLQYDNIHILRRALLWVPTLK